MPGRGGFAHIGEEGLFIASAEAVFPEPGDNRAMSQIGKGPVELGNGGEVEPGAAVD